MIVKTKDKLVWFLSLTLMFTVFACRKDLSNIFDGDKNAGTEWAQDYFNNVLLRNEGNQVVYKNLNKVSSLEKVGAKPNMKTPMWIRARAATTYKYDFVEVPLMYNQKITKSISTGKEVDEAQLRASFDRLVIYKDKKGKINQRIISYIPDVAYLERHKGDISHNKIEKLDKDFAGYLVYSDWDGNVLFRLRIDKGIARKLKPGLNALQTTISLKPNKLASTEPNIKNKILSEGENCYDVWEIEYLTTCYYDNPDDIVPRYCDPPVEINRTWIDRICAEDPTVDCSDPANFENAECQGYDGPGDEEWEEPPLQKEINNNITDSCLKATISDAIGTNKNIKGVISDIINKFAQKDNGITINLTDDLTSGSATTQITSSSSNKFVININFNANYFSDISKEAVVTRLIHEAVHAYLLYTDNDYKNLAETEQHNYLFTNYIDDMGDYLMEKYDLEEDEAYGLAWSGTDTYDNADGEDLFSTKDGSISKGDLLAAFAGFLSNDAQTKKGTPNCPDN